MSALCVHSPCWVQEELSESKPPPLRGIRNGSVFVDTQTSRAKQRLCQTAGQEQETREEKGEEEQTSMRFEGNSEISSGYLASLKACAQERDLDWGRELHKEVVEMGLLEEEHMGGALINMYAKCGSLLEAQDVFDELSSRTTVSWTSLISAYANHGQSDIALAGFERMKCEGLFPDRITFLSILKACGNLGAVDKSQEIHAQILKRGLLESDTVLGTALLDAYAKCNLLAKANEVFDMLHAPDVVAWNTLIRGYACLDLGQEALDCFEQMQHMSVCPNSITFSATLKACGSLADLDKGQRIHAGVVKEGFLTPNDIAVVNTLVDMYAKCGLLAKAQELFNELPIRNTVTWNALIAGHTQNGQAEKALNCFDEMQMEAFPPDAFTYSSTLKACGIAGAVGKGLVLHAEIAREGALDNNVAVGNALVDMYAKCSLLAEAQEVFENLCNQNVVAWSALIVGYANHGFGNQAVYCFEQMVQKGFCPNEVTLLGVLKACGSIGAFCKGQKIHVEIAKDELLEKDIVLGTALVDMYAKCGLLMEAQDVFDELPQQDTVSWNALLAGYSQYMHGEMALHCFGQMQSRGFSPDLVTFVCVLKACSCLGAAQKAQELHGDFMRDGLLEMDLVMGNALIDMYASCGMLKEAQKVFDTLPVCDLVSWNTLINGYAQSGKGEAVFDLFDRLITEFNEPDSVTFTLVLNTCCHIGLADKMEVFFVTMATHYGILPTVEHYACLIDLFSRTGHIDKVLAIMKDSPFAADVLVWNSLLGACQKQGNMKLGSWAFKHVAQLGERDSGVYVCMSNFYAAESRQDGDDPQLLHIWAAE